MENVIKPYFNDNGKVTLTVISQDSGCINCKSLGMDILGSFSTFNGKEIFYLHLCVQLFVEKFSGKDVAFFRSEHLSLIWT